MRKVLTRHWAQSIKCTGIVLFNLMLLSAAVNAQNCTANAGGNIILCGSSTTLNGSVSGTLGAGNPTWSFISGPVTPVIASPNSLVTNVTGMTTDGNYVFQLSQPCGTGNAVSQVTITAHNRPAAFTAGPDKTGICATVGTVSLDGVIPAGYTGSWTTFNIYTYEAQANVVTTNASISNTNIATPVFSLVNKANHNIDPAYYAVLTIVSADGVCTYRDTTVVRFCPNPALNVANVSKCIDNNPLQFFDLPADPAFSTNTPGSAGAAANGTTITFNVTSQPAGGNIAFNQLQGRRMYVTGAAIPGSYTFTITVTNCCGTVTSAPMTLTVLGTQPQPVNFQPAGHAAPEQLVIYASGGSGGEVHCGIAGTSTPELFYFSLDPADPVTTVTNVTSTGVLPSGAGTPIITQTGAGTALRTASIDPGPGGWKVGTYRFTVTIGTTCSRTQLYYIHISDNSRPPLFVPDLNVCYPGTGAVSANIPLPQVYQGVVNSSYFQDFTGYYNFQVISKPAGSATPVFPASNLRRITLTNVTVSNLDRPGDYLIRITPFSGNGAGPFLEQEYACSGIPTPLQYDFVIHLTQVINSNAGSDEMEPCVTTASLNGNSTGAGTGMWTVAEAPAGANPVFADPANPITGVSGLTVYGIYKFAWSITTPTGNCTTSDTVVVDNSCVTPVSLLYFNVTKHNRSAALNWATASESNNAGFSIERSPNGIAWTTIGFENSKAVNGNSSTLLEYNFTDAYPGQGVNYYRFKQTDIDGNYKYSPVKAITFAKADLSAMKIYPNPVQDKLYMEGLTGKSLIAIKNVAGKQVMLVRLNGDAAKAIDVTPLAAGVYIIEVTDRQGVSTVSKLIKE